MHWRPSANLQTLRARAEMLAACRKFFAERDVLEVNTPVLSRCATTEPNIASLEVGSALWPRQKWYLHTSPELAMKRLLVAGSGAIYQICTVFRDSDYGQQHRPEFAMLEWYRPGWSYLELMDEVEALLHSLRDASTLGQTQRFSYRQLFQKFLALDPFSADVEACRRCCHEQDLAVPENMGEGLNTWLDLLLSVLIMPRLDPGCLTFVYDYPADQAALAQVVEKEGLQVAERFELYWGPLELANGFQELTDVQEQRGRFAAENERRRNAGLKEMPVDEMFLSALASGMPLSAGVALGLDRLLMALTGSETIAEVITFDDAWQSQSE
ncbi:MAG: EF-P lysine aminoacylase GenX [Gammaproteobacteria bacterium]|nr:EF-P lysine aminoacylase GenX [Gammaproteobacteria bacterium]